MATCGRLPIGLFGSLRTAKRITNPLQDSILPHIRAFAVFAKMLNSRLVC
jgi:hypothetical protein